MTYNLPETYFLTFKKSEQKYEISFIFGLDPKNKLHV